MIQHPSISSSAGAALFGLALTFAGQAQAVEEATIKIDNFAFTPATITVKAGTIVTFENRDDIPHLVVATSGTFRSKALDTNDKYAVTLAKTGTFPYFCGLHPMMRGTIVVTP